MRLEAETTIFDDEEVAFDINEAAKTATNYMEFDETTGLTIGYEGCQSKVVVNGSGTRIYDGNGTDVAWYGSTIRIGEEGGRRISVGSGGIYFYDEAGTRIQQITGAGTYLFNEDGDRVSFIGSHISMYRPGTDERVIYIASDLVKIGGFDIVPDSNQAGHDYFVSDWKAGNVYYRTWIRSATDTDKGGTWAFSAQTSKNGTNYTGAFVAQSNGCFFAQPVNSSGNAQGGTFKVDNTGIYMFPNITLTKTANLFVDPSTWYIAYTGNSASSEQLKEHITEIEDDNLNPEKLYDVAVVQFRYKDGVIDERDERAGRNLVGFIIEDLNKYYPIAVDKTDIDNPRTWAWNSAYLIPPILKLVQKQKKQLESLEERLSRLEAS